MEHKRDYVPYNAAQFSSFVKTLLNYVESKSSEWTHIPPVKIADLTAKYNAFATAFDAAQPPSRSPDIVARQNAQKECTKALREFVKQYLHFAPVTDVDRAEMGIPNHDTVRTGHTVVTEKVEYTINLKGIRELVVDFKVQGAESRAKPRGYDGAVIIWGLADKRVENPDGAMPNHTLASRTPFTLRFDEADRGKTVSMALAWQNERGITGPWSEYKTAIIP
jgi:hypothetical protein